MAKLYSPKRTGYTKFNDEMCVIPDANTLVVIAKLGIRVNGFNLCAGRQPGYGHLLLLREQLTTTVRESRNNTLTISDGVVTTTIQKLSIVATRAVYPNEEGLNDPNSLFIVTIADERFFAVKYPRFLDPDPFPYHPNFGRTAPSSETYLEALESYWDESNFDVSAFGDIDVTNVDFPPELLRDFHQQDSIKSAWDKLNDVLDLTRHSIYRTKTGWKIQADDTTSSNGTLIDGYADRLLATRTELISTKVFYPEKLKFRARQLDENDTSPYTKEIDAPDTGLTRVLQRMHILLPNIYDSCHSDAGEYALKLDDICEKIHEVYYGSLQFHNKYNAVYFGIISFIPSADAYSIEYYFEGGEYRTSITSMDVIERGFPKFNPVFDDSIVKFRLLESLTSCGSAQAEIVVQGSQDNLCCLCVIGIGTVKDTIGVVHLDDGPASIGSIGWAKRIQCPDCVYDIIYIGDGCQQPADPVELPSTSRENPCEGHCLLTFNPTTFEWDETENSCALASTTTTTTTTADPCECPSDSTGTTTTTTTTTTPEPTCVCLQPDFCGWENGDWCVRSICVPDDYLQHTPECGGTTTADPCDTTTTTTTTADPECSGNCIWVITPAGVTLLDNDCPPCNETGDSCCCPRPDDESSVDCECVTTNCRTTPTTTTSDPDCGGHCTFYGIPDELCGFPIPGGGFWETLTSECSSPSFLCLCFAPSFEPTSCGVVSTPCLQLDTNPCQPTTTRDPDDPCDQRCRFQPDPLDVTEWVKTYDPCTPDCPCAEPAIEPVDDCDIAYTDCGTSGTTTTTSTTTTTTSEPPPPDTGACCEVPADSCTAGMTESACLVAGGNWMGPGSACTECDETVGACCEPDGGCFLSLESECTSPNGWDGSTSCTGSPCGETGICCDGVVCTDTVESACDGDFFPGYTCFEASCGSATTTTPPPVAACCDNFAPWGCEDTTEADCGAGHTWQGEGNLCATVECPIIP